MQEKHEQTSWTHIIGNNPEPRLWLMTEEKNLLLSWAMIQKIEASEDFLSIRFLCEYGEITLSSQKSLRELFDLMRIERVASIDGRALNCRILEIEQV